jgi:hypothetical protein
MQRFYTQRGPTTRVASRDSHTNHETARTVKERREKNREKREERKKKSIQSSTPPRIGWGGLRQIIPSR